MLTNLRDERGLELIYHFGAFASSARKLECCWGKDSAKHMGAADLAFDGFYRYPIDDAWRDERTRSCSGVCGSSGFHQQLTSRRQTSPTAFSARSATLLSTSSRKWLSFAFVSSTFGEREHFVFLQLQERVSVKQTAHSVSSCGGM